jgi:hypothetical protein
MHGNPRQRAEKGGRSGADTGNDQRVHGRGQHLPVVKELPVPFPGKANPLGVQFGVIKRKDDHNYQGQIEKEIDQRPTDP